MELTKLTAYTLLARRDIERCERAKKREKESTSLFLYLVLFPFLSVFSSSVSRSPSFHSPSLFLYLDLFPFLSLSSLRLSLALLLLTLPLSFYTSLFFPFSMSSLRLSLALYLFTLTLSPSLSSTVSLSPSTPFLLHSLSLSLLSFSPFLSHTIYLCLSRQCRISEEYCWFHRINLSCVSTRAESWYCKYSSLTRYEENRESSMLIEKEFPMLIPGLRVDSATPYSFGHKSSRADEGR